MVIDKDMLRWVLLIGAAPIWVPFLRALWKDFNRALREDGGLMGSKPGPKQLERIRAESRNEPDPLVSEPKLLPGQRRSTRMRAPPVRAQDQRGRPQSPADAPDRRPAPGGGNVPRKPGFGPRQPPGGR